MERRILSAVTDLFFSTRITAVASQVGVAVIACPPADVVARYLETAFTTRTARQWPEPAGAPGNSAVRVRSASVYPEDGALSEAITVRTPFCIDIEYWNMQPGARLTLALNLYNEQGIMVFSTGPVDAPPLETGLYRDTCRVPGDLLNDGLHRAEVLFVHAMEDLVYRADDLLTFEVDLQDRVNVVRGPRQRRRNRHRQPRLKLLERLAEQRAADFLARLFATLPQLAEIEQGGPDQ